MKLRYFLESIFGEGDFSALAFIMMLAWFNSGNSGYLIGGSLPIALRMANKFKLLGGKLTLGQRVIKIIVENDTAIGVILTDGTEIKSDIVISAADGYSTIFKMLEGKYLSDTIKEAYQSWKLFTPIVQVSFGINKEIKAGSQAENYLFKGNIGSTVLETGYSIMNYSYDPTMAPEGKTVIILRFESPWELWENLSGHDYHIEKRKIGKDALSIMEKHYPGIREYIEVMDIATPRTEVRYTGVWKASYEGFLPTSQNISKSIRMTLPGLNNFFMVGQWLTPGGGLPPSGQSGKWVFQLICHKDKKKFKVK